MKKAALLTIVLVAFLAVPAVAQRSAVKPDSVPYNYWSPYPPPKPLNYVRGHWTPYRPPDPATFPEEVSAHIIQSGDTLWVLANRFYGDNLLWPFLWEHNTYITDPHWIYPGDPLLIPPLVIIPPGELERVEDFQAPDIGEVFLPAGSLSDMYCSFYLTEEDWKLWDVYLIGGDDALRIGHGEYDVLYVNKGSADGITPGQEFTVLSWERELKHPLTREEMGHIIRMMGTVRVLCAQEHTATVVVTDSCGAIEPGMRLRPFETRPSPLRPIEVGFQRQCVEPFPYGRGHVIYLDYDQADAATWDRVAIDLGSEHGVLPGDTFLVYTDILNDQLEMEYEVFGKRGLERFNRRRYKMDTAQAEEILENAFPDPGLNQVGRNRLLREIREIRQPRRVLGEIVVLATQEETSTGILTYSAREIMAGDKIELKAGQAVR